MHLIDLLNILLTCNGFISIQKTIVDKTGSKPPVTVIFFWYKFGFGKCFGASSQSNHWTGHCWLSYKIHFLSYITIPSSNDSSLLHRIKEDDTSKWQFLLFFSQLLWHPLIELLHLSSLLKCQPTVQWSVLNSLATSAVVVRGSAVMILSLGHCQFLMAGQCARHLQGFLSFAKLVQLPLPCMFVNSSWARCVVDTARCLCCFTIHFKLE